MNDFLSPTVLFLANTLNIKLLNAFEFADLVQVPVYALSNIKGAYIPMFDTIGINHLNPTMHLAGHDSFDFTVLHELIHWSGHSSRLRRSLILKAELGQDMNFADPVKLHTEEMIANYGALSSCLTFRTYLD